MEEFKIGEIVNVTNGTRIVQGRIEDIDTCADGTYAMFEGEWFPICDISKASPEDRNSIVDMEKRVVEMKKQGFRLMESLKEPEFI